MRRFVKYDTITEVNNKGLHMITYKNGKREEWVEVDLPLPAFPNAKEIWRLFTPGAERVFTRAFRPGEGHKTMNILRQKCTELLQNDKFLARVVTLALTSGDIKL